MPKISNPFGESALTSASGFGSGSAISPISHVVEPLDLSGINDPSLQIVFKNLSKKDHENTKIRALEDLANFTEASPDKEVEDGGFTAWVGAVHHLLSMESMVLNYHRCDYTRGSL